MAKRQRARHRFILAIAVLGMAWLFPSSAFAVSAVIRPDLLQQAKEKAQELEDRGRWEEALSIYDALLVNDRSLTDIKERYLNCLRHIRLIHRHRDATFRQQVLRLPPSEALRFYEIVLGHLRKNYVERTKVAPGRLFQQGVEELRLALSDASFIEAHVPAARRGDIPVFKAKLTEKWGQETPTDPKRASALLSDVAQAAREKLGLKATVTVVEFVCGACNSLDEFTVYLTPAQLLDEDSLEGEFVGIGIQVTLKDQKLVISQVLPNSPAALAGLQENDQIIRIGQRLTSKLSPEAMRQLLRGEAGSSVEIEVVSSSDRTPRPPYRITRQPSVVNVRMFDEGPGLGIGYLRIAAFQKSTLRELDEAIDQLRKLGMKALVLDLRRNQGGLFEVAVQIAERFLAGGRIVAMQGRTPETTREILARGGSNFLDMPLVVLVDGETASAAEVLAGALKENNRDGHPRATLVGQPTYGKGSIQRVLELKLKLDELKTVPVGVRMTLAKLFSPLNHPYSGTGVAPHIQVERLSRDLSPDRRDDNQLNTGVLQAAQLFGLRQSP